MKTLIRLRPHEKAYGKADHQSHQHQRHKFSFKDLSSLSLPQRKPARPTDLDITTSLEAAIKKQLFKTTLYATLDEFNESDKQSDSKKDKFSNSWVQEQMAPIVYWHSLHDYDCQSPI